MNFKSLLKIKGKIYNGAPSRTLNVISGPALVQFPKGVSFLQSLKNFRPSNEMISQQFIAMTSLVLGLPLIVTMTGFYFVGALGKVNREKEQ